MRTKSGAALVVCTLSLCSLGAWRAPRAWAGAQTGSAHLAQARRGGTNPGGLEAGLPSDGRYARGLELDAAGRHTEALREYGGALDDLSRLVQRGSEPRARLLAWRAKIVWQKELSEELLEQEAYTAVMPGSMIAHYHLGRALHAKFLSIRAFNGRRADALWKRARAAYERSMDLDGEWVGPRVGLAQLFADVGQIPEARREFAQVGARREGDDVAMLVAAYLASMGDLDGALGYLVRAVRRPEERRFAQCANDFDRLRADPTRASRFKRLVGAPWADTAGE